MPHFCGRCEESTYMIYLIDDETAKRLAAMNIFVSTGRVCAECHAVITLMQRGYSETEAIAYLQTIRKQEEDSYE